MGGTHKNRRGKGSRGGTGWAGSQKHHAQLAREVGRAQGKYGFKRPQSMVFAINTINVGKLDHELPTWVARGEASESGGTYEVDLTSLGYDKLLGSGRVTRKIKINIDNCSPSAKVKIEEAGGSVKTTTNSKINKDK
jgi:large subunit ribosomal protein L15